MPVKQGAAGKEERATGRKHAGAESDKRPEAGERQQFRVSGYTHRGGKKREGYYKQNPAYKRDAS